jgi:DnaD/phage-associated family protein
LSEREKELNNKPFPGFPNKMRFTPLPNLFFSHLLPQIDNLVELKAVLHIFWLMYQKRGYPRFATFKELAADKTLMEGINEADHPTEALHNALEQAVNRGILLRLILNKDGQQEELYFINNESGREAIAKLSSGELSLGGALPQQEPDIKGKKPDIFTLYEENIGLLSPMIAEELKQAEELYPPSWIEEAFKEAVSLNKRSWRYICRILERWAAEGKKSGESRGDFEKKAGSNRYLKGRYGHLVRH